MFLDRDLIRLKEDIIADMLVKLVSAVFAFLLPVCLFIFAFFCTRATDHSDQEI